MVQGQHRERDAPGSCWLGGQPHGDSSKAVLATHLRLFKIHHQVGLSHQEKAQVDLHGLLQVQAQVAHHVHQQVKKLPWFHSKLDLVEEDEDHLEEPQDVVCAPSFHPHHIAHQSWKSEA